jgi:hypothetical protein
MKRRIRWFFFFAILLIVVILIYHRSKVNFYDGFETSDLNNNWSSKRMESSSLEMQSAVVRKGKSAVKITLRTGDMVEAKTDKDNSSERDELLEALPLYAVEGARYEYQFSMFLPDSFPITSNRLVIAQWKQFCPFCSCSEYSPILAIRYISGKLFVTLQTGSVRDTLYTLNDEIKNRWLDFRFQIKFSKFEDGEVTAFLNDKEIIKYEGKTSYPDNCRILSAKNKYFFKMGLYRDRMPEPMSIYIDEYKKREY